MQFPVLVRQSGSAMPNRASSLAFDNRELPGASPPSGSRRLEWDDAWGGFPEAVTERRSPRQDRARWFRARAHVIGPQRERSVYVARTACSVAPARSRAQVGAPC